MKQIFVRVAGSAFLLAAAIVCLSAGAAAQTTLAVGDIAFSGYNSNITPDDFSFVLLKNISAGTVINFTDNAWLDTNVFRSGEQNITWTATSALSAGQEIRISGTTASLASGPGSPGTVTGTALSLSTGGDQILAFQGTIAAPVFITGIHMNVYVIPVIGDPVDTTAATWDFGNSNNTNGSNKPAALTTGTNALWIGTFQVQLSEKDNARFNCGSAPITTVAQVRAALNNPANYSTSDFPTAGFALPSGCAFLAPSAAEVSLTGRVRSNDGRGLAGVTVTLTDGNGGIRSARTNTFGYYRFADLAAGDTVVLEAASKRFQFGQPTQIVTLTESLTEVDFTALP